MLTAIFHFAFFVAIHGTEYLDDCEDFGRCGPYNLSDGIYGCRDRSEAHLACIIVHNPSIDPGAIILGKSNLHEMALESLSISSLSGQTLDPYDYCQTLDGSSGGIGAAMAASFVTIGIGTNTVKSLRSPASASSLFSIRPTKGLICRKGIIPISGRQDAVGPLARNV